MHVPNTPPFRADPGPALVLTASTTSPVNVSRAISFLYAADASFRVPLFRAVMADEIALAMLLPGQAAPLGRLDRTGRPAVLVVNDDDDDTRLGPSGWPCAARIMRWAGGAIIHGSGGQPEHYAAAVLGAVAARRLVLIETGSAQIAPWVEVARRFIPESAILRIQPFPGGVHPTPMPREAMQ